MPSTSLHMQQVRSAAVEAGVDRSGRAGRRALQRQGISTCAEEGTGRSRRDELEDPGARDLWCSQRRFLPSVGVGWFRGVAQQPHVPAPVTNERSVAFDGLTELELELEPEFDELV